MIWSSKENQQFLQLTCHHGNQQAHLADGFGLLSNFGYINLLIINNYIIKNVGLKVELCCPLVAEHFNLTFYVINMKLTKLN